jgi:5-hydroxyisourate hydrolase-like protein (transthyretin family)
MEGTNRVRYCAECKLNVYNFSEMSPAEIDALIAAKTGRLCARFYQRTDGTMLTQNCPVGFRGAMLHATRLARASLSAIIALSYANPALARRPPHESLIQIQPINASLTIEVVDPGGAVIPSAKISVLTETTKESFETTTDEQGRVTLSLRSDSIYSVKVIVAGFVSKTVSHLQAPFPKLVAVRMELGSMGEVVSVPIDVETPPTELSSLKIPAAPTLPSVQPGTEHRNALARFFSKLLRIF